MKFFLDTADTDRIRDLYSTGLVDGVTTNPSLIAKSGKNFFETLREISSFVAGPISAEVTSTSLDGMIKEGEKLSKIAKNIVIKLPLNQGWSKSFKFFLYKKN